MLTAAVAVGNLSFHGFPKEAKGGEVCPVLGASPPNSLRREEY